MATFDKIKELLKNGSGRCVVLCNNDPCYVAMTWQEYKKFANIKETDIVNNFDRKIEDIDPVKSRYAGIPTESELFNGVDIKEIPL